MRWVHRLVSLRASVAPTVPDTARWWLARTLSSPTRTAAALRRPSLCTRRRRTRLPATLHSWLPRRTAAGFRALVSHPIRTSKWCAFIVQRAEPRAQSRYRKDDERACLDPAADAAIYAATDCCSAARRTDSAPAVRSGGTGARAAVHP